MNGDGPLAGLVVVDMGQLLAAPEAAMLLADFGATVIKVEPPTVGDISRKSGWEVNGTSVWWRWLGRNKYAVTINIKDPRGQKLVRRLIDGADVLIENMRPGKLEAANLAPEDLHSTNPDLVILRVTGWGQTGPYSDRACFGTQVEAMSGFAAANGQPDGPPTLPTFAIADAAAGYLGAFSVMTALHGRDKHPEKRGEVIDLSLMEAMFGLLGPQASAYSALKAMPQRIGSRSPMGAPRNIYKTRDERWLAISCTANRIAHRVFTLIGQGHLLDDPEYSTPEGRLRNVDKVDELVQAWVGARDGNDVIGQFSAAGATVAPVYTIADIEEDEHFASRKMIVDVPMENNESLRMQNVFPRFQHNPGSVKWSGRELGADNTAVFMERLGLSQQEFEEYKRDGVI
ncbi:CaiB/BaiF CoA transferase family protein [Paraburkholderia antibiotica]|uniref:CoA transferase n=1 Tax=Paraburkholderia antibiotica TaxID=2728839 RepID=A0A7Y0A120_9BURK|nr:CoA transferase [Paraburkholderia antibiotica]NML34484.1 CoA transferase [Paraburkholderia antibiotica]